MKFKRFDLEMIEDEIIDIVEDKTVSREEMKANLFEKLVEEFQIELVMEEDYDI